MSIRLNHQVCIAPMLGITDKHFRFFLRLLSPHVLLYSEMVVARALLHNREGRYLDCNEEESPIALQLAGNIPEELAECAKQGERQGYNEINLNMGCPSPRVQAGGFGACLMKNVELSSACVEAVKEVVHIPVTVKMRIGVEEHHSYDYFAHFAESLAKVGCDGFIIHARGAILKKIRAKINRRVPPLCYDVVYQLKRDFPEWLIIINGEITTGQEIQCHLQHVDGVMIGREIVRHPDWLFEIEETVFDAAVKAEERAQKLNTYLSYIQREFEKGEPLNRLLSPLFGIVKHVSGAKKWRKTLSKQILEKRLCLEVIRKGINI